MDRSKGKLPSSKLSAFFETADDEPSFPPKAVDNAKLSQYTSGNLRKSRREKEQEAAEAKKREEEIDAAKAYAEFLDAFEGEDVGRKSGSTFVRSSTESGSKYALNAPTMPRSDRRVLRSPSPQALIAPKAKGKRAMDAFLEEIKKDQAEREAKFSRHAHGHGRSVTAMAAYEGQSGSKDRGDPQTTNVFVANLPGNVTEHALGNFFARAGPVGSVKIMWPRPDAGAGPGADMTASRKSKNAGLSGFVSYMTRKDAEEALRQFDGFDWGGSVLRVGWSKAVPVAAKPMFVADSSRSGYRSRSRSWSRDRSRSASRHRRRSRSDSYSRSRSPKRRRGRGGSRERDRYRSSSRDEEAVTDTFIRAVAAEVKGQDSQYEEQLRRMEENNPKYTFLKRNHRRYSYYRDLIKDSRPASPEFDDEGYNSVYSTDSAEESERERTRKNKLGRLARKRFEAMLRALSGKKGEIARCMAFCLEHAEAAHEVTDIIVASLLVDGTPVPRKVARLYLICDILHNSAATVPSAWKFRQEFQARLGIVFDHMANIYHSFPGRITAETFKKQITSIVDIWEDWIVFSPDFTSELRARLEGNSVEDNTTPAVTQQTEEKTSVYSSRFKASTFQAATSAEPSEQDEGLSNTDDVDGAPMGDDVDGIPLEDVDGVPLDDIDGAPLEEDDVDGAPIEDIDGEPMEDVDGEPMDDVDGVPMEA